MCVLRLDTHVLLNSVHIFYSATCNSIRSMRRTNRLVRNSFRWQIWRQKTCQIFSAVYLDRKQSIPFELNWTQILEISGPSSSHTTGQCPASANLQKLPSLFEVQFLLLFWSKPGQWLALVCESSSCKTGNCQHQFATEAGQGRKLKIAKREKKLK